MKEAFVLSNLSNLFIQNASEKLFHYLIAIVKVWNPKFSSTNFHIFFNERRKHQKHIEPHNGIFHPSWKNFNPCIIFEFFGGQIISSGVLWKCHFLTLFKICLRLCPSFNQLLLIMNSFAAQCNMWVLLYCKTIHNDKELIKKYMLGLSS